MIKLKNLSLRNHITFSHIVPQPGTDIVGEVSDLIGSASYDIMQHYDTGTNSTPAMKTQFEIDGSTNQDPNNDTSVDLDTFRFSRIAGREIVTVVITFLQDGFDASSVNYSWYDGPNDYSSHADAYWYHSVVSGNVITFSYYTPDGVEDSTLQYLRLTAPPGLLAPLQYTIQVSTSVKDFSYPITTDVTGHTSDASTLTDNVFVTNEIHYSPNLVNSDYLSDGYSDVDVYKFTLESYTSVVQITTEIDLAKFYGTGSIGVSVTRNGENIGTSYVTVAGDITTTPETYTATFYGLLPGTYYITFGF